MSPEADFIQAEIPAVRQIVQDECWLEGERRHQPIDPTDAVIQERVAEIILARAREQLRQKVISSFHLP